MVHRRSAITQKDKRLMSAENGHSKTVRLMTTRDLFPVIQRSDEEASRCLHMSVLSNYTVAVPRDPHNPDVPMLGGAQTLNYGPCGLMCRNKKVFNALFGEFAAAEAIAKVKMVPVSLDVCRMCVNWESLPVQTICWCVRTGWPKPISDDRVHLHQPAPDYALKRADPNIIGDPIYYHDGKFTALRDCSSCRGSGMANGVVREEIFDYVDVTLAPENSMAATSPIDGYMYRASEMKLIGTRTRKKEPSDA